ncbi:hypothetical protein [Humibacter sp.]|uniref:hypothetical protein n=1 Tax=Humibacter sp. TaxID=1940291 RepID=UPI003F7DF020
MSPARQSSRAFVAANALWHRSAVALAMGGAITFWYVTTPTVAITAATTMPTPMTDRMRNHAGQERKPRFAAAAAGSVVVDSCSVLSFMMYASFPWIE